MKKRMRTFLCLLLIPALMAAGAVFPLAEGTETVTVFQNDENGRMYISKSVAENGDGTFTVDILSYVTEARSSFSKTPGMDIILMMDRSNSMSVYDGQGATRKSRAVTAVHDFLLGSDGVSGLSGLGFDDVCLYAYTFGGLTVSAAVENMKLESPSDYQAAYGKVKQSMSFLKTYTCTDRAMRKCRETAENNLRAKAGNRLQMVILVTDGLPGQPLDLWWVNDCSVYADVWDSTVREANLLKSLENTRLLTISMIPSLGTGNGSLEGELESMNYPKKKAALVLLNVLSSDWSGTDEHMFSDGTYTDSGKWGEYSGGELEGNGYYRPASTASEISGVMLNTVESVASAVDVSPGMTDVSFIRDGVPEYFEIVAGSEKAYLYGYAGSENGTRLFGRLSAAPSGTFSFADSEKIEYSGFDYGGNAVSSSPDSGGMLDIRYTMRPKDEFLGGVNIGINLKEEGENVCGAYCSRESGMPDYPAGEPTVNVSLPGISIRNPRKTVCFSGTYSENFLSQNAEYEYRGRWSGRIYPVKMYDDDEYNEVWWELNSGFVNMYDHILGEELENAVQAEKERLVLCFGNFRNENFASGFLSDGSVQYSTGGRTVDVVVPLDGENITIPLAGGQSVWAYSQFLGEYNPYRIRGYYDECGENEGIKNAIRTLVSSEFLKAEDLYFTFGKDGSGGFRLTDISTGGETYFDASIDEFRVTKIDAARYPVFSSSSVYADARREIYEMYDRVFGSLCDAIADDMEEYAVSAIERTPLYLAEKDACGAGSEREREAIAYLSALPYGSCSMGDRISEWTYTMTGNDLTGNSVIDSLIERNMGGGSGHAYACSDACISELKDAYGDMLYNRGEDSIFSEKSVAGFNHGLDKWVNEFVTFGDISLSDAGFNETRAGGKVKITDVHGLTFNFVSGQDRCVHGYTGIGYSGSVSDGVTEISVDSQASVNVLYPVYAYTCAEYEGIPDAEHAAELLDGKLEENGTGRFFNIPCDWKTDSGFSFVLSDVSQTGGYINYLEPEMEWNAPYLAGTEVTGEYTVPDYSPSYVLEKETPDGVYRLSASWGDGYPYYVTDFFADDGCGYCEETSETEAQSFTVGRIHAVLPDIYFPVSVGKSGCDDSLDDDMTFMFGIYGEQEADGEYVSTPLFPVHSNSSVGYMLKAGTYCLYEEQSYSPVYSSEETEFTVEKDGTVTSGSLSDGTVVLVNTRSDAGYHTGNDWNDNVYVKDTGLFESRPASDAE